MQLHAIESHDAPAAIGPYSQGVVANGLLFTAGQIALDPVTGVLVSGDIVAQTERVMANLSAVLAAAGSTWSNVIKTTIYLHDMSDFPAVNEIYGRRIASARPARSTVQVAALPRGALIEIDAVATVG